MEKWFVTMKKADFNEIAAKYHISPIVARLMRNRDIVGDEAIDFYKETLKEDESKKKKGKGIFEQ